MRQIARHPHHGEPTVDLKSAETRWLLIKNPRFGDVPQRARVHLGRGGQGPDDDHDADPRQERDHRAARDRGASTARRPAAARSARGRACPTRPRRPPARRPASGAPAASRRTSPPARAATTARCGRAAPAVAALADSAGYVVFVDTTRIVIDLTAADGLRPGTVVSLRRDRIPIVHPVTGEVLGELDEEVATARVDGDARPVLGRGDPDRRARRRRSRSGTASSRSSAVRVATPTLEQVLKERVAALVGEDLAAVEAEIRRELDSPVALIQEMGELHRGRRRQAAAADPPAAGRPPGRVPRPARACAWPAWSSCCTRRRSSTTTWSTRRRCGAAGRRPTRSGATTPPCWWAITCTRSRSRCSCATTTAAVMETLARATVSMTEAEVFQLELKRSGLDLRGRLHPDHHPEDRVVHVGLLPDRRAARAASPPSRSRRLTRYGLDIGIAFQISDDALDFVADQDRLGKAIGADLREGKRTLPLIAMLERATARARPSACGHCSRRRTLEPAEIEEIRRLVLEHDGVGVRARRARTTTPRRPRPISRRSRRPRSGRRSSLVADFVVDRDR